jgi:hypothetical protein
VESHYNSPSSTPPANAALSNSPTFCRNVGLITGCALLVTAGATCVCIFVAALPLLPVLLVGVTIAIALASVCIWSIYRLKKLNGEQKKQELSSEPHKGKKPPIEIPGEEKPRVRIPEDGNPQTGVRDTTGLAINHRTEQSQFEVNEPLGPETSFGGEQPRIETSKSKEILDDSGPPIEPPASGEESPQPPIDPIETQENAGKLEPPIKPQGLPEKPDGEEPGNPQSDVGTDSMQTLVQSRSIPPNNSAPKFSSPSTYAPETETIMDLNDPGITNWFREAVTLIFYGMKDNKFLFECCLLSNKPEPGFYKPEPGFYFSADNIEGVWGKFIDVKSLEFSGELPKNFQIPGNHLSKLGGITFQSKEIKSFEAFKHLTGTFDNLSSITFNGCSKLHSARISGNCIAPKFHLIKFNNCPNLDEVYIGNNAIPIEDRTTASEIDYYGNPMVQRVHIHPGINFFYSRLRVTVQLDNCRNLLARQTYFNSIIAINNSIYGSRCEYGTGNSAIECCKINGMLEQKSHLLKINGKSTISLSLPAVTASSIKLMYETLDLHVVMNFDLAEYKSVTFLGNAPIKHLEMPKPMDDCYVEFEADPNGTLLDINQFPQNSTVDTGEPFKMSFQTRKNSKLPTIKLNNVILKNSKWYKLKESSRGTILFPVTPRNQANADKCQDWIAIGSESAWNGGETVVINSACCSHSMG